MLVTGSLLAQNTIIYDASTEDFPNPERGVYRYTETRSNNYTPLRVAELVSYRSPGSIPGANYDFVSTLVFRYFFLGDFTEGPISQAYLDNVAADMATARQAGVKLIPRFAYTDAVNGNGCGNFICPPYGDAPKDIVLTHVNQLKPVLQANADIIATVQMGFIGTWGEQYYTDYFGDASGNGNQGKLLDENWNDRNEVLAALLDAVPANRTVQVRYPQLKQRAVYGINAPTSSAALTDAEAYDGSDRARIGFHNDCFLAGPDDFGTFTDYGNSSTPTNRDTATLKPYFAADSRYVPVGGETCSDVYSPENDCISTGGTAEAEMRRFHYSYLNSGYNNEVNNDWQDGGCMDDIKRQLGYRFQLQSATFPTAVSQTGEISVQFSIGNLGYAAPYNERDVQLILRNAVTGEVYVGDIDADPRRWSYEQAIHQVASTFCVPSAIPAGSYELLLNLPDPEASISSRPEYSIRLANTLDGEEVWEPETGYNNLGARMEIVAGNCTTATPLRPLETALPVNFTEVRAVAGDKDVEVTWSTSNEVDNAGFAVERSPDGIDFRQIATAPANDQNTYLVTDAGVVPGKPYFYRVQQTDLDGIKQYSQTVNAQLGTVESKLTVYPNPSAGVLTIDTPEGQLQIFDHLGRRQTVKRDGTQVDVSSLSPGIYTLLLRSGDSTRKAKVIINR